MIRVPFETNVTKALADDNKRVDPDTTNRKPYRSAALKADARKRAEVGKDGAWRATTPVLYHPVAKKG